MNTLRKLTRRLFGWLDEHFLEVGIGILLIFIPIFPKIPLIDIPNTWVYIRVEDFLVLLFSCFWLWQVIRKQASFKTPLTPLIIFYWLIGGISLVFSLVFLRKQLANFFPNVALLHYFRRIEYFILFFVAYSSVKDIKIVKKYLGVLILTAIVVCFYGFGQKLFGWPAFLTMNEEFAKGIPLRLPPTARIPSTFAGHYDLAAWLVLIIALFGSLFFALKKIGWRLVVFLTSLLAFFLLLLTASRISFFAYLLSISLVLWLNRKKWLIVPVVIASFLIMNFVTGTSERFGKTLRVERVVYDIRTGRPVGTLESESRLGEVITEEQEIAGEELPLGTGYIGLPLRQSGEATKVAVIKKPIITSLKTATKASEIATISGEFLIRRALVYDISFTTRFQGTWPRAFQALKRNPLFGSGYSSINLATDSSYFRALGETGLLGFLAFFSIYGGFFLLIKKNLGKIKSAIAKSFVIGTAAGLVGLFLNAVLIDVFEASKVAFTLTILMGISVGLINYYVPEKKKIFSEFIKLAKNPLFQLAVLIITGFIVFYPTFGNYFVGDDFTWLRWTATAKSSDLVGYFLKSEGFFYRPLAKVFFYFSHPFLDLRPAGYHLIDFILHLGTVLGAYLLIFQLTKKKLISFLTSFIFLLHPLNAEPVFWISSTSIVVANFFLLWGFLSFWRWLHFKGRWRWFFYWLSLLLFMAALASHELAVVFPLLIIWSAFIFGFFKDEKNRLRQFFSFLPFFILLLVYLYFRNVVAKALGLSGDYNYNPKNLVFNFPGNLFGYIGELVFSFRFIPVYDWSRQFLKIHKTEAFLLLLVLMASLYKFWNIFKKNKIMVFSFSWGVVILLPFLGLGNIAERYFYLAKLGFILFFVVAVDQIYHKIKKVSTKAGALLIFLALVAGLIFYISEFEKAKREWRQAGEMVNKTLLAVSSNYAQFPRGANLYFVNLPIRLNRAWVFPVGLKDGLWFIYRDETLVINQTTDLEKTLDVVESQVNHYVFLFENGELKRVTR